MILNLPERLFCHDLTKSNFKTNKAVAPPYGKKFDGDVHVELDLDPHF